MVVVVAASRVWGGFSRTQADRMQVSCLSWERFFLLSVLAINSAAACVCGAMPGTGGKVWLAKLPNSCLLLAHWMVCGALPAFYFFSLCSAFLFLLHLFFFSPFSTDTRDLSNFCDVRKRHFVVTHRMVPSAGSAHVRILMFSFAAISCPYEIASQASSGREHCSPSSLLVCVDYVADGTAPRCRVKNASFTRSEQRVRH